MAMVIGILVVVFLIAGIGYFMGGKEGAQVGVMAAGYGVGCIVVAALVGISAIIIFFAATNNWHGY